MGLTVAVLSLFSAASAQNFSTKKISFPETANADPTISGDGLAAWMYFDTNITESSLSHIGIYLDGESRALTEESGGVMYGSSKPYAYENRVLFLANFRTYEVGSETWVLREVADRDEGEYPEIDARYSVGVDADGNQVIAPVNQNTNDLPVVGMDDPNEPRRLPSGDAEVWLWTTDRPEIRRVTHDYRNDYASHGWGETIAWQKAKGWPFGWEIMAIVNGERLQLTTNYYYDMGPKVHGSKIVWYGWDGFDYEIFMNDTEAGITYQITSNRYDDVAPAIWNDVIVWEGYPAVESDIYMWKDGEITKISSNIDDDLLPKIWNNKVVWQGFDGDDFEIYLYDVDKGETIQVTGNRYDDTNPEISDDLLVWMGYEGNWDAEIFAVDTRNLRVGDIRAQQLTNNEEDDRDPKTGGGKIIWIAEEQGETGVMIAEPR